MKNSYVVFVNNNEDFKQQENLARTKGYDIDILDFCNLSNSTVIWTPFHALKEMIYNEQKFMKDFILDVVNIMIPLEEDGFMEKLTKSVVSNALYVYLKKDEVNINIIDMLQLIVEKSNGFSYLDGLSELDRKILKSEIIYHLDNAKDESLFKELITYYNRAETFSCKKLNYLDINQPNRVILIRSDESDIMSQRLSLLLFKHLCVELKSVRLKDLKNETNVNFRILNLERYPKINDLIRILATTRASEIRFEISINNFNQLNQIYKDSTGILSDINGHHRFISENELIGFEQ